MRTLALYVLKGRSQAILMVSLFGLLAFLLPPLIWISSAMMALISFRQNLHETILVFVVSLTINVVLGAMSGINIAVMATVLGVFWGSVGLAAVVLKNSASLARSILFLFLVGIAGVLLIYGISGDPAEMWRQKLANLPDLDLLQQMFGAGNPGKEWILEHIPRVLTGILAAGFFANMVLSLLLGRWLQALLYNPGGFQREFHSLRMGSVVASAVLLLVVSTILTRSPFLASLLVVGLVLFVFQGLAVIHGVVKLKQWNTISLVIVYVAALFLPEMTMLLSMLGLIDTWLNVRGHVQRV